MCSAIESNMCYLARETVLLPPKPLGRNLNL
ncbi:hypothetical protein AVEN_120563-1, partial [Araneus ventricosus]